MSYRRRWDTGPAHHRNEVRWIRPPRCGYCHKLAYATRRAAKQALRALFPGCAGNAMHVVRCPNGGQGWHVGHRPRAAVAQSAWPAWNDAAVATPCTGCAHTIAADEPVAWLNGRALCIDCGDLAGREALAS